MRAFTTVELANLAKHGVLPGLSTHHYQIARIITAESWPRQPRQGRGGGWEYFPPEPWRTMLAVHEYKQTAASPTLPMPVPVEQTDIQADKKSALRRDAKLYILNLWERFQREAKLPVARSMELFCVIYGGMSSVAGEEEFSGSGEVGGKRYVLAVPAWVREERPSLCSASLATWRRLRDGGTLAELAGAYGNRRNQGILDRHEPLKAMVVGLMLKAPHWTSRQVLDAVATKFGESVEIIENSTTVTYPIPSLRNLQRWMAEWKRENESVCLALLRFDQHC